MVEKQKRAKNGTQLPKWQQIWQLAQEYFWPKQHANPKNLDAFVAACGQGDEDYIHNQWQYGFLRVCARALMVDVVNDGLKAAITHQKPSTVSVLLRLAARRTFSAADLEDQVLGAAIHGNHLDMVQLLLDFGANATTHSHWVVRRAIADKNAHLLQMVVDKGALQGSVDNMMRAAGWEADISVLTILIQQGGNPTLALIGAARASDTHVVAWLLDKGADACAEHSAALAHACVRGSCLGEWAVFDLLYPLGDPGAALAYMRDNDYKTEHIAPLATRIEAERTQHTLHTAVQDNGTHVAKDMARKRKV